MEYSIEGFIREKEIEKQWDEWDEWILREIIELSKMKTYLDSMTRQDLRDKSN